DPGHYGDEFGHTTSTCAGKCLAGYLCPAGSSTPTHTPCGSPAQYCPVGSFASVPVQPGWYSIGGAETTRSSEAMASKGYFTTGGLLQMCPGGTHGAIDGLASPKCSGTCRKGYYCPPGSISDTQRACGGAHLICPTGSLAPQQVTNGFYTATYPTSPIEEQCPPGMYRDWSGSAAIDPT
ncbi:unnamed protein product, partial [Chrysoparadoxa australica]